MTCLPSCWCLATGKISLQTYPAWLYFCGTIPPSRKNVCMHACMQQVQVQLISTLFLSINIADYEFTNL